jgi:hypothetical protein
MPVPPTACPPPAVAGEICFWGFPQIAQSLRHARMQLKIASTNDNAQGAHVRESRSDWYL